MNKYVPTLLSLPEFQYTEDGFLHVDVSWEKMFRTILNLL